jgi:hypothetical protein
MPTMQPSPLTSKMSIVNILPLLSLAAAQLMPGGSVFSGSGAPGAAPYHLVDDYESSIFFDKFFFDNAGDQTNGHVQCEDRETATALGLYDVTTHNTAYIGVDCTNMWPP